MTTVPSPPAPTAAQPPDLNLLKLPPECRRPFEGENSRSPIVSASGKSRVIPAAIRSERNPGWVPAAIRDYSLFGFGLHIPSAARSAMPDVGERVELRLLGPRGKAILSLAGLRNIPGNGDGHRVGLERLDFAGPG